MMFIFGVVFVMLRGRDFLMEYGYGRKLTCSARGQITVNKKDM